MLKDYGRHELYGTSQTQKVAEGTSQNCSIVDEVNGQYGLHQT